MNNSTPSTAASCFDSHEFSAHYAVARFAFTYISYPLYIVLWPPAHILLLIIFYKQYKTESAYMYQIIAAIQTGVEGLLHVVYNATLKWLIYAEWFGRSYSLIFFATHIVTPLYNGFIFFSLFVALSMTIDRIFAIARPVAYMSNTRKGLHQAAATAICAAISIGLSFFDYFRAIIIEIGVGQYSSQVDTEFVVSRLADIAAKTRNVALIFGVLLLILCNLILARLFAKSHQKVVSSIDASVQKKKRSATNTLIFLSMAQALSVTVKMTTLCAMFMSLYIPQFSACGVRIFDFWLSLIIEACDLFEVYLVLVFNKKCRSMATELIPFLKRFTQTT